MPEQLRYSFGENFQSSILSLIVRDPSFAVDFRDALEPSYFEDPHHSTIAKIVLEYIDRKSRPPELPVLQLELTRFADQFGLDEEEKLALLKRAVYCYQRPPKDEEFVRSEALSFAQHQALKSSVRNAADMLHAIERGKANGTGYDDVRKTLNRGLHVGSTSVRDLGFGIGSNIAQVQKLIRKSYQKGATIPTGFLRLDKMMKGGLGRGEVGIIFGPPKRGKSTVLVNIGAAAANRGFGVVHYSFELRKADVVMKYACRATGLTDDQIMSMKHPDQIAQFTRVMSHHYGQAVGPWIMYERPGQVGPDWIRSHLSRLQAVHGFKPDLIIIDFMDRMKKKYDDLYQSGGDAMEKFTALGADFKCAVWTASQAGRQSEDKERVGPEDISESWRKMADCDVAISLNQTPREKIMGEMTLFVAGQRRGMDTRYVSCLIDYERSRIKEKAGAEQRKMEGEDEPEHAKDAMGEYFEDEKPRKKKSKSKKRR